MDAQEALQVIRLTIEEQGPDTPNRHYGRNQHARLLECCDLIQDSLRIEDPVVLRMQYLITCLAMEDVDAIEAVDGIDNLIDSLTDVMDKLRDRWKREFPGSR